MGEMSDSNKEGHDGLFRTLTEILNGVTQKISARMAIEHACIALLKSDGIHWCGFLIHSVGRMRCLLVKGETAPSREALGEAVPAWRELSDGGLPVQVSEPGFDDDQDGPLFVGSILDHEGLRLGLLVCRLSEEVADQRRPLLGLLTSLISVALEHERLNTRAHSLDRRHLALIESLPSTVYEENFDGSLDYISPKISELCGYRTVDILEGAPDFIELIHPEDRKRRATVVAEARERAVAMRSYEFFSRETSYALRKSVEYRLLHKNGRDIVWVADHFVLRLRNPSETLTSPVNTSGMVLTGVLVDLRERKRLEIESLQQSRLATVGELAATVAHEINNPLTAILTYGQLLQRALTRLNCTETERAKATEYLGHINDQGRAIYDITRNLTGFVRKDTNSKGFHPLHASELVTTSLAIFRYTFKRDRIALDLDVPVDLPPVRGQAQPLRQVLLNLFSNARASLNSRYPSGAESADDKIVKIIARVRNCLYTHLTLPTIYSV